MNVRNSLILGILYLTFQAFPVIFRKHNFNDQEIGLSFLGIGLGMIIALSAQPYFNRHVHTVPLTPSSMCSRCEPQDVCTALEST